MPKQTKQLNMPKIKRTKRGSEERSSYGNGYSVRGSRQASNVLDDAGDIDAEARLLDEARSVA